MRKKYRNWRGIPHGVLTVTQMEIGPEGTDYAWAEWLAGLGTGDSQLP